MTVGTLRAVLAAMPDDTEVLITAPEGGLIYGWVTVDPVKWSPAERGELPVMSGYGNAVQDAGGEPGLLLDPWGAV